VIHEALTTETLVYKSMWENPGADLSAVEFKGHCAS